jgi:hypothetical protein
MESTAVTAVYSLIREIERLSDTASNPVHPGNQNASDHRARGHRHQRSRGPDAYGFITVRFVGESVIDERERAGRIREPPHQRPEKLWRRSGVRYWSTNYR